MSKIEITDITIKIGQKKVTLSPDEARELMEALEMLLGAPEPKVVERIIERSPWRYWYTSPTWAVSAPGTMGNWTDATGITTGDSISNDAGSYTLTLSN